MEFIIVFKTATQKHPAGDQMHFSSDTILLGRDPQSQVLFDDSTPTVCRRHAQIVRDGEHYKIVCLSQTNTTMVNGNPVNGECILKSGDEIMLSNNGPVIIFKHELPAQVHTQNYVPDPAPVNAPQNNQQQYQQNFTNFHQQNQDPQQSTKEPQQKNNGMMGMLNEYMGNDQPSSLNWKALFDETTKKHTDEEAEAIFISGTSKTTPRIEELSKEWPHPWLYSRVFLMFAISYIILYFGSNMIHGVRTFQGLTVIGAFTVPISAMVLFTEVNAWRNISLYKSLMTFFVGGCASMVLTFFLQSLTATGLSLGLSINVLTAIFIELGKAGIICYFLQKFSQKNVLNGLLIGASVGAGFAAFWSIGMESLFSNAYSSVLDAYNSALSYLGYSKVHTSAASLTLYSNLITPAAQVAWAAISGAALTIAAKGKGAFDFNLLCDMKFLRLFIIPIILHSVWNAQIITYGQEIYLGPIIITVLSWIVVLVLINMGLTEVNTLIKNQIKG